MGNVCPGAVLAVAIGGAIINFHLIAPPMQEMVGGSSYIMGYKAASIAALVIILVEVAMGLFLMESLRITRLFPLIAALDVIFLPLWLEQRVLVRRQMVPTGQAAEDAS